VIAPAETRSLTFKPTMLVGPLLLVAAFVAWWVSDRLLYIGPFDRAQIGWGVVVPLAALAPWAAALVGRDPSVTRASRHWAVAVSLGLGLALILGLAATVAQIGCQPVNSPFAVLPLTIVPALVAGSSYWSAYTVADRIQRRRGAVVALVVSAGLWVGFLLATVLAVTLAFPGVSCAAPQ
jgi:hypothetical protein